METENLPVGNVAITNATAKEETVIKLGQKDAVYLYTREVLTAKGITTAEGEALKNYVSKEVRKEVRKKLFDGVKNGVIGLKSEKTDSQLKKYCSGLINNWLKKDPRFN